MLLWGQKAEISPNPCRARARPGERLERATVRARPALPEKVRLTPAQTSGRFPPCGVLLRTLVFV